MNPAPPVTRIISFMEMLPHVGGDNEFIAAPPERPVPRRLTHPPPGSHAGDAGRTFRLIGIQLRSPRARSSPVRILAQADHRSEASPWLVGRTSQSTRRLSPAPKGL